MSVSRDYFAGRYAAQEARRAGTLRANDHDYARGAIVDTDETPDPVSGLRSLSFILPMPPSVNALYGTAHTGQKFLLGDQRHFRRTAIGIVRRMMRGQALTGRINMGVLLYFSDRRRADISNRLKALEDALTHAGVYADDSQIDELIVTRIVRPGSGEQCAVHLREIAA